MGSRVYEIEVKSYNGIWERSWTDSETNQSVIYRSKRDAKKAIKELIEEEQVAFDNGFIQEPYFKCDYRVVRTDNAKE